MKKLLKYTIAILLSLTLFLTLFSLISQGSSEGSTTENIEVISKGKNTEEQWIVLSSDKKIYIDNFSIWALIEKSENYTIVYRPKKNSESYQLVTIVPGDYNGQF